MDVVCFRLRFIFCNFFQIGGCQKAFLSAYSEGQIFCTRSSAKGVDKLRFSPRIVRDKNFLKNMRWRGCKSPVLPAYSRGQNFLQFLSAKGGIKTRFFQRIVRAKKFSKKYAQKWLIKTPFSQRIVEGYFLTENYAKAPAKVLFSPCIVRGKNILKL